MQGIHVALYQDGEGVKFVFKLRLFKVNLNILKVLRKKVDFVRTPEMNDPIELAQLDFRAPIQPEDM